MADRVSAQTRPRGRHSLRSRAFADELVRDAGIPPGTLALDLGAGAGALTRALTDAGAPRARDRARSGGSARARDALRRRSARADRRGGRDSGAAARRAVRGRREPPVRRRHRDPAPSARRPARSAHPAGRDRGVGAGGEADRGLAFDAARLQLGSLVRAEDRPARAERRASRRRRASTPRCCARRGGRSLWFHPKKRTPTTPCCGVRSVASPLDRVFPRGVVHRVAHELGFDPRAAARDLDARQWATLYAAVRSATPRPRAAGSRRRRGSRR